MRIMQFGRYKGKHIKEVPSAYLAWIVEKLGQDEEMVKYVQEELERRIDNYDVFRNIEKSG